VELGRAIARAGGFAENDAHLRREVGARRFLGLPRGLVDVAGMVDRRNLLDRCVARGDVAVFSRLCRRCGGSVRDCGGETDRGNQPENGGERVVHVRWSVAEGIRFKKMELESSSLTVQHARLSACQVSTV
jgi:hypothetical protein